MVRAMCGCAPATVLATPHGFSSALAPCCQGTCEGRARLTFSLETVGRVGVALREPEVEQGRRKQGGHLAGPCCPSGLHLHGRPAGVSRERCAHSRGGGPSRRLPAFPQCHSPRGSTQPARGPKIPGRCRGQHAGWAARSPTSPLQGTACRGAPACVLPGPRLPLCTGNPDHTPPASQGPGPGCPTVTLRRPLGDF